MCPGSGQSQWRRRRSACLKRVAPIGERVYTFRRMKITDLKCAIMGGHPIIRITTDEGIDGIGQVENSKPYLKPHVLFYKK